MSKPNKQGLAELVAAQLGKSPQETGEILKKVGDSVIEELFKGKTVTLPGAFSLHLVQKPTRMRSNPRTGKKTIIPPQRSLRLKIGKDLKAQLNTRTLPKNILLVTAKPERWDFLAETGQGVSVLTAENIDGIKAQAELSVHLVIVDIAPDDARYDEIMGLLKSKDGFPAARALGVVPLDYDIGNVTGMKIMCDDWLRIPAVPDKVRDAVRAELARAEEENIFFRQRLNIKSPSDPANTEKLGALLEGLLKGLGFNEDSYSKVRSALLEAIDNGARHGNKSAPDKFIHMEFVADKNKLVCNIRDEGVGFDYENHLKNATDTNSALKMADEQRLTKGKGAGLGILLMGKCVDELAFTPPGNVLTLVKYFKKPRT
ncbi:MAG: ATP-binding protein [Planctomycetes bacterium]|nr:ATP-binding protein [Planctomycetota bacterium]